MPPPLGDRQRAEAVRRLRAAGCVFAEEEAQLLVEAAGGPEALARLVARRCAGTPLEHVLGWVAFCGLRLEVDEQVFVPRRRTELLVDCAAAAAPAEAVVVDLCTGSGAVAAAVADRVAPSELHAQDLDERAARCARRNLARYAGRVHVGDLYAALPPHLCGRVHVLTANAPYVPTDALAFMPAEARLHEPRTALDGGSDGLDLHRRIAGDAARWLAPGGTLLLESSARQADATAAAMTAGGLAPTVVRDASRDAVVVAGRLVSPA